MRTLVKKINFLIEEDISREMELLVPQGKRSKVVIEDVLFSSTVCHRCFAWMKEKKVTFYDAVYLSSAIEIQGVLITADERLVKKIGKTDHLCLLNYFQIQ